MTISPAMKTRRLPRFTGWVGAKACFGNSPCIRGLQRLRIPPAAEGLIEAYDRLDVREARLHQIVLRLEQRLLGLQNGNEVDRALVQALLGNIERALRTGDDIALQAFAQSGLTD